MRKICLRCGSKFGSQADFCPHDGTQLVTDDEVPDAFIGTVLLEQFRVDALIGTGGMGTVYRARQTTIDRDVAVKVLRLELAREQNAVVRFEREAQLAASLDHPNLVRVLLSGRLADGRLYIVMELLEGRSLADELDDHGAPSLERGLIMLMKLCAGLDAVHAKGIVHRDIKPENVYLVTRGADRDFIKLVDFGISRTVDADSIGTESQSGRVFGTAPYISPEAATGDTTDRRSDIYSVGVLAYQLLTGELPFEGATAGAVLMQHVHEAPPSIHTKGVGDRVPPGVGQVVMRALEKDPADRFQTVAPFVDALVEAAVDAGLLRDARPFLLGTVWGDELAAPGSALADLLSASSVPALGDTVIDDGIPSPEPVPLARSLASASDIEVAEEPPRRRWKRSSVGSLILALIGAAGGAWWWHHASEVPVPEAAASAPAEKGVDADVRTGRPGPETPTFVEVPPEPTPVQASTPMTVETSSEPVEPPVAPSTRRERKPRREKFREIVEPPPTAAPSTLDEPPTRPAPSTDDGIDWTVPGFSEDELGAPTLTPTPEVPPAPTGMPNAPAVNPVVIDEVPGRNSSE